MKSKDLREKNIEELKKLLEEKKKEAGRLRFEIASVQVKDHQEYRNTKKDIARILTILKESK